MKRRGEAGETRGKEERGWGAVKGVSPSTVVLNRDCVNVSSVRRVS